jgi:hypothetical protein
VAAKKNPHPEKKKEHNDNKPITEQLAEPKCNKQQYAPETENKTDK